MKILNALAIASIYITNVVAQNCWANKLSYRCCSTSDADVVFKDGSGEWAIENGDWCGIIKEESSNGCWANDIKYECCESNDGEVYFIDDDGKWGIENGSWCGIIEADNKTSETAIEPTETVESTETNKPVENTTSSPIRDIPSKELIKEMKFGWNLGNTLDAQCIDNLDYEKDQTASETCWGNPKTTEDMFKVLMDNQFNVFRIPTTWSGHFGEAPDYKINEKWLKRVHEVVDYAYKNGAFVILNIHHETWNHAFSETLETAKEILEKIWTQIAEEFKDYDEHLIFEGLNEPRKNDTPVEWNGGDQEGWDAVNAMNAVFLKTIRSSGGNNSKRHLMIPPYAAACNENAFKNYIFPEDDDKVIASVHAYQPYNFALNNGEGAVDKFDAKGKNELDWNLGIMKKRFVDQGIPMILGEYGAMNRDNDEERAKWAEYYMEKVTAMGVPQVWWDNGIFEGEGERFGIFDRSNLKIVYPGIVAALQKGRGLEVNVVHAAEAKPKPEPTEVTTEATTEATESTETTVPINPSTGIRDISSKELIKEMKFGWNLGNTLDAQCIDNLDYEKDQTASETCWGNPKTTEDMFKVLMDNQFNVFRIPTTWSGHFGEAPDYKINEKWLKRVHEVVDYAYKNGAFVILNIHHETWNHAFSETLETAKEILEKIWTQIAEEFKDYDEHLIFEGLNEPRKNDTPVEWNGGDQEGWDAVNAMNAVFLKTIRSSGGNNSKRHLMIPPYAAACNENAFKNYIFPEDDDKVIASVHAYQPYNFALNNGEGAVDKFDSKGKNELDWNLGIMKKRFVDQGIPMILGEYGAMNRDNDEERAKWAEYYMEKVTAMGVPQVWWDNGIFEGEGERFGIFDRSNLKIVYPGIVAALQKGRGLEVNVVHAAEAKPKPETTEATTEVTTEAAESTETTVPINPSTGIRDISSKELIKEMKFGWNLGNTLDAQCIDNLDYEKDQTASETCWGNPKTTEDMFKVLMDNQFNVFRIPTTWSGHFGEAPDYKINEKWLKRVHEVVDYAYKNGAFVILNIHHETWNHAFSETLETAKEILEKIWTQIAEEFKDYDEHLIFEGLNEPRKNDTPVEWNGGDQEGWDAVNAMNAVFLKTIRSSGGNNLKRHLMIPPYAAACNENAFKNYIFPEDDDKVIASVHAYQPYNFALNNGEGAVDKFDAKGKNELDWNLGIMKKRFVDQGIPMILGEYGAMNRDNDEERAKWAEYYMEKVTAMGVPQVWWDNGIFEGEGERFGIFDRSNLKIVYPGIVAALQKGRGLEVNVVHAAEAKPKPETTEATTEVTTEATESTETTVPINPSTGIRDISSKELIKEMKFGWNLGNTLDAQCIDNLDYEKDQTASETCWGNPKTTEDMFKVLMDNQFNVFRIPTTWSGHFGEAPDYKINEKWLKRVHEVVDYAYKNGAFVILNIHHETWNHAFSETLETAKEILEKIWTQIAEEFKDYDEHLIFEGLNEPRKNDTPVEWNGGDQEGWDAVNAMNAVFLKTIRSSGGNNSKRHLMIPPYAAACNENAFKNYIFPEDDDKVIASVHAYQPYNFALNNGEGAVDKFDSKGKNELDWNLGIMKKRFVDQGIPMILGEYGAMNRDNDEERAKWAEYYMEKVTAMGVPQVWWDNGIFEGEGERFGIFDRSNLKIVYPGIVAALQKGRGLEVNVVHAAEAKPKPETTEATTEVTTEAAESTETTVPINPSTGIRDISSKELIKEMKFGWNLGNTLDAQCIDNLDYEKDQTASETCWGNPKTTEDMFKVLMDNQFNVFRIPTTWSGHFGEAPDYKINEKWLKRVHEVVDYAYKNGAFVILNIHHETWNHAFSETLETAKEILEKIWTQIAEEFKDYDEHLIFEGLNEPRKNDTPVEWNGGDQEGWDAVNAMNAVFLKTIRSSGGNNLKRHLMIPPYAAACNENAFKNYIFPEDDDKVIASVHAYQPYNFALNNGEGAVDKFDAKGKNELDWNLGIMKKRFVDQGIPMILGEYGAMNRDNDEERAKWAEYYMEKVTAMGVPQVWWDNGIFEGEGERFGIFDRSNLKIVYPGIVAALQKGRGLEVNVVHAAEAKPKPETTEATTEVTTEATESTETTVPINPSTGIRDISSKELIKEMKFGWNLGNTLDAQCIDNLDYEKDQTASETCWGNPKTTEDMFKVLMDNQFNVFRIPTTWSGHFGEAPDYKINEKWLKRVHEVVDYAYKNGAFVILNIHHETWNHAFSETLETAKEILEKIWTQIAEEFKDYDEHLIFEGLNEPRKNDTPVEWNGGDQEGWDAVNAMNAVFLKTIRSSGGNNSKRHLMIPPYAAACNENAFKNYIFPEDDDKVIASVHAYQPYNFALNNGEGAVDKFDSKGKNELDWNLGIMKKRFVDQGIPMILGEYGAMNRDNDEERAKWAEYYMEKVTAMGVPQVWWDNGIFEGEGERFGIFDRSNLKIVYPGIVAALQKGRGLEVNVVHAAEAKPKPETTEATTEVTTEAAESTETTVPINPSTGIRDISSKELIKEMKFGWNLGNTLDAQCIDNLDYEKDQTASETCWGNPKTTEDMFKVLMDNQFNVFRIPTTWSGHFGEAPDYKINEKWLKRVHEVVDYAYKNGAFVILNIHHETWNHAFSETLETAKEILEKIWTQIAEEFKDYDEHLIFEGLNEPRKNDTPVEWNGGDQEGWDAVNAMNAVFLKTIRSSGGNNSKRHLMIPPYAAACNENAFKNYIFPEDDDKVIASVHAYQPYNFALNNGEGAVDKFDSKGKNELDWNLGIMKKRFVDQGIPMILGEYGAMNRDNDEERAKWAEYYMEKVTAMGVPQVWWDNGIFEGEGERFGIFDRSNLKIVYPGIVAALQKGRGLEVNVVHAAEAKPKPETTEATTEVTTEAAESTETTVPINPSTGIRDISSKELIKEMKFGWNLGNTLDAQCIDNLDYEKDQTASETCWGNPKTTEDMFKVLMDNQFNVFRIPTTWSGHFGEAPDYKINEKWLKRVHEVVDYAYKNGAFVILNIHHETWNHAFSETLETAKEILEKIWTQIAEEFKDYDEHLIFEGLNEPRKNDTPVEWNGGDQEGWDAVNAMNAVFLKTIRSSGGNNLKRHLMIPPYAAACNENAFKNYIFPEDDDKVIASVHAYQPYNFALNNGEGAVDKFDAKGKNELDWNLGIMKKRFVDQGIPMILGEYGAMNRDNDEERAKWAEYYMEKVTAMGVPQVWWDNGIFEGEGERFGIFDRSNLKIVYPGIVAALQKGRGLEVNVVHAAEAKPKPETTEATTEVTTEATESTETTVPINPSTGIRDISSKELIKEMKFGWNLGNTLDAQCIDNLDYEKDQTASETCWGNPKTTEDMFKVLMDNQFNVFRIPTTWSGHFGEAPDYKINEKWLKRVHEVVDYAYKNGAFVILNIHHETWNHAFSETLETAKEILEKIWTQIAEEFKDYDEHLIFEGLNEPRKNDTPVEWNGGDQEGWDAVNAMNAVFLKTIRSSGGNNSKRHLMIPPYAAACNENAFKNYIFPEDDDKVIASVHAYQPYNFALNNGEGAVDKFDSKGKNELDWNLGIMKKRFVDQGIPMILGEYGAMNRDNDEERAKWAEYYMEKVTAMGVPQVWWDNGIFEGEGERFGIFDRSNLKIVYPGIVAALQKGRGLEVNVVHAAEAKPKPETTEATTEVTTEAAESTETTVPINPSTGIRDISSKELIKEMKFGWNLGNTLDAQCIDNLDYEKDQTASETCWGNPKTTEDMFKVLMDNQFNVFRIPTTWSGHFGEAPDYKINEKWLKRVHEVVDYAYKNGAFVILNIHHETWNHAFSETLETAKEILEKIWTQIAEEFKDYDEHLIFEGLNEPRKNDTPVEWNGGDQEGWDAVNAMNAVFLKTIRSSGGNNLKRHLMIPPYAAACNENAFKNYIFPEDDDKVIASVHAYQPYNFALNNGEGAVDKFDAKGKNELDWNLGIMKKRFVDQGIPMILGEYGAMNRDNDEERAKWAEYYMEKVTAMGVPQVWWDNGIFEGEGERFGIFDRSNLKIVYPGIVAALQKGRGLEVNVVHAAEAKPKPETTEATTEVTTEATESTETTVPINPSTGIRDISSKELIKEMKFGWNLGNTLDAQCIDNLDYEKDQTASETCWGNPKTTEDMFKVLMDNQFNVFRIPTTWSGHFGEAPDYKINEKWLKRVHEVVDYAYKNGAFVILNIHHETWNHAFSETLETAKEILEKIWTQIAEEFKDYDEHLIFEGLNEPRKNDTPVEWNGGDQEGWDAVNAMNAVFLKTIRSSGGNNSKRHLMIPPYAAACNENAFKNYIFPEDDDKVIASVHAYQPYNFALNNGEGAVDKFDAKGKNELDWNLGIMKKRFVDQGIPMILGEYGAMNRDNDEERAKWAEYYMEKVTAMGVPQVWWDNGIFEGEGERFGIFDRSNLKIVYPGIVAALQKGRGLEVNVVHAAEAKPKPEPTEVTTEATTEATESTETTVPINPSTGIRDISSKELIKEMKFGWNLGNTLDAQCIDNLDYEKDQTASETCWGNPKTTEDMFKVLMDNQFNVFRIPTTWSGHFGEAPDYKINEKWLKRVHEVVDYAYKNGAFVILNIHHETWNHAFSETLETAKEILEKIWTQIAEEFKDYDEHLIFEGLNEPRKNDTPVEWNGGDQEGWDAVNAMNAVFLKTIRSSGGNNSKRHLMIPPYAAACNENAFKNYIFPEDDDKVIASVHAYQPYNFALNNGEGAVDKFDAKGKNELDWNLGIMKKRFVDQGIPMILGEYGAMNRDNDEERAKWAEYYMEKVTAMGVPQVWWDNGIFEGEGERFGIFDRSNLKIVYPGIVAALQKGRGLEVNVVHAAETKPKEEKPKECWSKKYGYECCSSENTRVVVTDETGKWGVENGQWCGVLDYTEACWSLPFGYKCCTHCKVLTKDENGKWGEEKGEWCGIIEEKC